MTRRATITVASAAIMSTWAAFMLDSLYSTRCAGRSPSRRSVVVSRYASRTIDAALYNVRIGPEVPALTFARRAPCARLSCIGILLAIPLCSEPSEGKRGAMRRTMMALAVIVTIFALIGAHASAAATYANPTFQTQWQMGEAVTPTFWDRSRSPAMGSGSRTRMRRAARASSSTSTRCAAHRAYTAWRRSWHGICE